MIEWRKSPALVRDARKILHDPSFVKMLECLRDENPVFYPLPKAGVTADDRSYQLGMISGACYIIDVLKQLGEPLPVTKEIEQTYHGHA